MSVHYKFRSSLEYDTLKIDGQSISLGDLRDAILTHKKISKSSAYTLEITDAQTKKIYSDDRTLIPKNSSVIVKRVPATSHGAVASYAPMSDKDVLSTKPQLSLEKLTKTGDLANANASEEDKIKAMMSQAGEEWTVSTYSRKTVPSGSYTCFNCGQAGHYIRNCPNVSTSEVKYAPRPVWRNYAGIPKDHIIQMMKEEEKKRTAILEQAGQTIGAYRPVVASDVIDHDQVPPELLCAICKKLYTDAVLIPCCGSSYCDDCIRNFLIEKDFVCPNCQSHMSPDQLVANVQLRKAAEKHRNQLEGINKGVTTVRSAPEPMLGNTTPENKKMVSSRENTVGQQEEATPVSSVPETSQEEDSLPVLDAHKHADPIPLNSTDETKEAVNTTSVSSGASSSTSSSMHDNTTISEDIDKEGVCNEQKGIVSDKTESSDAANKAASQAFLTKNLPFSSASLHSNLIPNTIMYNNYLATGGMKPRLPVSMPPGLVMSQAVVPTASVLPHSSTYHAINMMHPRMKADQGLLGTLGICVPGVPRIVRRPPILDPMMVLDKQRPLSEEEFYRTQKKLKSFSRHRRDSGDNRQRFDTRTEYVRGKKRDERSRHGREKANERARGRTRDKTRDRNEKPISPRRRKRSRDSHRRQNSKQPRPQKPHLQEFNSRRSNKRYMSSRSRSKSWSPARSRSLSRSRSRSRSRSVSRSISRSISRSSSRSMSPQRSNSVSPRKTLSKKSFDDSPPSVSGGSERSWSYSHFSGKSSSLRSDHSLQRWSSSPDAPMHPSPIPDDAISLSPSSDMGFSDSGEDVVEGHKTSTASNDNHTERHIKGSSSRHKHTEYGKFDRKERNNFNQPRKTKHEKEVTEKKSKEKVDERKSKSAKDKGSREEGDEKVKDRNRSRDVKTKTESVVISKVQKCDQDEKRSHSKRDKQKHEDRAKEVSKKLEIKSKSRSGDKKVGAEKLEPVKRFVGRVANMDEEHLDKVTGLQISKDRDGTVREVLTSRARKRVKEDYDSKDEETTTKKSSKVKDGDGKVRIVCVVEADEKKRKKAPVTDQRRVVLSTSAEEPEHEIATKSKVNKKKSKTRKHKKLKHKKGKKKKHKQKKAQSSASEEESDVERGQRKNTSDIEDNTESDQEGSDS